MLSAKNVTPEMGATYYSKENYYSAEESEDQSRWFGQSARKLGLVGEVEPAIFEALLRGKLPNGEVFRKPQKRNENQKDYRERAGLDLTFSVPKSVSLQALVQGDERLIDAHRIAVERTLTIIEQRYAQTRLRFGEGERRPVVTGNLVVAQFDHDTSRELDPHLHTHCVLLNMTWVEPRGRWYSLHNDLIYQHKKLMGQLYHNELATLVKELGYEVAIGEEGLFELAGFDREHIEQFSKRRMQILQRVDGESTWAEREKIWDATRTKKGAPLPRLELQNVWRHEARSMGLEFPTPGEPVEEEEREGQVEKAIADGIAHCSEREVAFKTEAIERFVLSEVGRFPHSQVEAAIAESSELIHLDGQVTTEGAVQRELATIRLMQQGQGTVAALSTAEEVEEYLEQLANEGRSLTVGQQRAIALSATSTDSVLAWQGVAGAGKTFALNHFKQIAEAKGFQLEGFAPSAEAAKVLADDLGIETQTVDRLLFSQLPEDERDRIWVVDEAGLLSAKNALKLLQRARDVGTRVVLVGDTRQLSAVEAGNPFKSLQQAGMLAAQLDESIRQRKAPDLEIAVDLVAKGKVDEGIEQLFRHGRIEISPKIGERQASLVQDYLDLTPAEREKTLILTGRHESRYQIIEGIREGLRAEGGLGEGVAIERLEQRDLTAIQTQYAHHINIGDVVMPIREQKRRGLSKGELYSVVGKEGDRLLLEGPDGETSLVDVGFRKAVYSRREIEIAPGDILKWTRNDKQAGHRNGQQFWVESMEGAIAQIQYADGRFETVDFSQPQHVDYAWVATTYSSQGKTAERVLVAADESIDRESFYVAISRTKRDLKLYSGDLDKLKALAKASRANANPLELLEREPVSVPVDDVVEETYDERHTQQRARGGSPASRESGNPTVAREGGPVNREAGDHREATGTVPGRAARTAPEGERQRVPGNGEGVRRGAGEAQHSTGDGSEAGVGTDSIAQKLSGDSGRERGDIAELAERLQHRQRFRSLDSAEVVEQLGKLSQDVGQQRAELNGALVEAIAQLKAAGRQPQIGQLARSIQTLRERAALRSIATAELFERLSTQLARKQVAGEQLQEIVAQLDDALERFGDRAAAKALAQQIQSLRQQMEMLAPEGMEALQEVAARIETLQTQTEAKVERLQQFQQGLQQLGQRFDSRRNKAAMLRVPQRLGLPVGTGPETAGFSPPWRVTPELVVSTGMDEKHLVEIVEGSGVDPAIVALNWRSLHDDEAFSYLLYSDELERTNTGRLTAGTLRRYDHLYRGGWWCSGVDPLDGGDRMIWGRFKPDEPRSEHRDGKQKVIKYEGPPKTSTRAVFLDVPRQVWERVAEKYQIPIAEEDTSFWQWVRDRQVPIQIVEGSKKAGALLSQGYAAVALPGIWNGVRKLEDGSHRLIPELQHFATEGREIVFVFDNDDRPSTRMSVNRAIARTASAFAAAGAEPYVAQIVGEEKGVDDLIVARGGEVFDEVYRRAERFGDWASRKGLSQPAIWWEVYSKGTTGNLLERAEQATVNAFEDGRTIPDAIAMLSTIPEYKEAARSDRPSVADGFVTLTIRNARRRLAEQSVPQEQEVLVQEQEILEQELEPEVLPQEPEVAPAAKDEPDRSDERSQRVREAFSDLSKLKHMADSVRDLSLESVAALMGLEQDLNQLHQWRSDRAILSIRGSKFYDFLAQSGGGGAIDLYMHLEGASFKQAVGWLYQHKDSLQAIPAAVSDAEKQLNKAARILVNKLGHNTDSGRVFEGTAYVFIKEAGEISIQSKVRGIVFEGGRFTSNATSEDREKLNRLHRDVKQRLRPKQNHTQTHRRSRRR